MKHSAILNVICIEPSIAMAAEAELEEWFKAFDVDGNGKIDSKELKAVIKAFYEWQKIAADDKKLDDDVAAILKDVDSSGDGKIDKKEFFKYMQS